MLDAREGMAMVEFLHFIHQNGTVWTLKLEEQDE